MYGGHREFEGRITGFTMGTGQTLALLPPQNATGNFVKIVQRLPVRIELTDYDPDAIPMFVGLSVVPYVYYKEPPSGPKAGKRLQPFHPLPPGPTVAADGESPQTKPPLSGHPAALKACYRNGLSPMVLTLICRGLQLTRQASFTLPFVEDLSVMWTGVVTTRARGNTMTGDSLQEPRQQDSSHALARRRQQGVAHILQLIPGSGEAQS